MTRAIAFIPAASGYEESAARCIDYIRERGYEFKGLVRDWATVRRMLSDGEVTCAIVADLAELDPDRKPRIEVVSHPPKQSGNGGRWWDERTRVIRRPVTE